ncbi:sialin-like [Halichondria panicea]|uniref:sialin-like n=1 Tax=Halichondria panicea TaxID=6063 RepID=UPI00312BA459
MDEKTYLLSESTDLELSQKHSKKKGWRRYWSYDCLPCIPARYSLALVSCLGFVNVYALRVNLSVAIVQMVNSTTTTLGNQSGTAEVFDWSSQQVGWVLGAFFYGYLFTQIPGGLLATKYGGRWVFGIGIVMTALLTLLTPLAAQTSVYLLIALRVLEGFFEGVTFPAMHSIWAKWAPPAERSRLSTISYAGPHIGNVISFPLSAVLCEYGFDGGWPSVFYVFGAVGILWFFLWFLVGFSSPASHPRISTAERDFIESSIDANQTTTAQEKMDVPWLKIFTSPAVWAITVAHFCNNWGFYTLLTCIPTYFKQAVPTVQLQGSIVMGGVYSAIPYMVLAVLVIASGLATDFLRSICLSTTTVRKIFTSASFLGGSIFLLLCGYFGTDTLSAVLLLSVAVGSTGFSLAGFNINHLDIAPRFAGVLMGITNSAGTIPGFVGPVVAKSIAVEPAAAKGSPAYYAAFQEEWREVFILSAEIYIFGMLIYLILGSGQEQPWAQGKPTKQPPETLAPEDRGKSVENGLRSKMPPLARIVPGTVQVS